MTASGEYAAGQIDLVLADECAKYYADPYGWVMMAFDWGHGELEGFEGPDTWQRDTLIDIGEQVLERGFNGVTPVDPIREATASGHGIGKALRCDDVVPTPLGMKIAGRISKGDVLFGEHGQRVKVKAIKKYTNIPFYRVTFSDKSHVDVSSGHLWKVKGRNDRRTNSDWQVLETIDIVNLGVKRPNGAVMCKQWEIPRQKPVDYLDCTLKVDAYTYGAWLGDGDKRTGRLTNIDHEVWDTIPYKTTKSEGMTRTLLGLKVDLCNAGLHGCTTYTAAVHRSYIESSDRLQVLQGLLDTDGWVEQCGSAAFASASRQLTIDVVEICRSLGLIAREPKFKPNDHAGSWQTHITWDGETELFKIKRKQNALIHAEERYQKRWIDSIDIINNHDGVCFEVEGGLFLTKDFHVTHNSALTSWLILWIMSTRPYAKGIVTANTSDQLRTKTWGELGKWRSRCIVGHWFEYNNGRNSMSLYHKSWPESWRVDAQTCREENSEAFAGLHSANSTPFYIFDEASAVPDKIWEVAEGGLTDGEPMFFVFGNPTRNTGKFRECFNRSKHRWVTRQIDSRTAKMTNKKLIQQWMDDWGEDSDFFRVRVLGRFPRAGDTQFIPSDDVFNAQKRGPGRYMGDDPLICGIDIARGGDDNCMIGFRRGKDAKSEKTYRIPGEKSRNSMKVISKITMILDRHKPDVTFMDETGIGGPMIDRLVQLGYHVIGIGFGWKADDEIHYSNKTAEMGARCRQWLMDGGSIVDDPQLEEELTSRDYWHNKKDQLVLEDKPSMKKRIHVSPDWADMLYLTFAQHVPKLEHERGLKDAAISIRGQNNDDYDPLSCMDADV